MSSPLHITILPASTQAGKETIRALLSNSQNQSIRIRALYRDPSKASPEFTADERFSAGKGDVASDSELDLGDQTHAVFYIPPPIYDGTDTEEFARKTAGKVRDAIIKNGNVKRLLLFSALGAWRDSGIGILKLNHISEEVLKNVVEEVVIIRPTYFAENWASSFKALGEESPVFYAYLTPLEHKVSMVSLLDIAHYCSKSLLETGSPLPSSSSSPFAFNLLGPRSYSAYDVKDVLEKISGKTIEIKEIEPKDLTGFFENELPMPYARELAEMVEASNRGGVIAEEMEEIERGGVRGKVELEEALRRMWEEGVTRVGSGAF